MGGLGDLPPPPNPESQQKLSKKNGIKLVGYTFRLKKYFKSPPPISLGFFRAGAATGRYPPDINCHGIENRPYLFENRCLTIHLREVKSSLPIVRCE